VHDFAAVQAGRQAGSTRADALAFLLKQAPGWCGVSAQTILQFVQMSIFANDRSRSRIRSFTSIARDTASVPIWSSLARQIKNGCLPIHSCLLVKASVGTLQQKQENL